MTAKRVTRYLSVILRWAFVGATVFTLTMLAGLYVTDEILPKVYTASVMMQLPADDLVTPTAGSSPEPVAFQPEFENIMMSPDFLLSVVKDLGLDKEWAKRIYKLEEDQLPDVDSLTHMEKAVKIKVDHATNVVRITAASDVPKEAADIANAMAEKYKALREGAEPRISFGGVTGLSTVRILSRAEIPDVPTKPNKEFAFIVTAIVGALLSVMAASFVEIIFLFLRAGERPGN